jgi:hypothetical protein
MKERELVECVCGTCGTNHEVAYDTANDYYICSECYAEEILEEQKTKLNIQEGHDE